MKPPHTANSKTALPNSKFWLRPCIDLKLNLVNFLLSSLVCGCVCFTFYSLAIFFISIICLWDLPQIYNSFNNQCCMGMLPKAISLTKKLVLKPISIPMDLELFYLKNLLICSWIRYWRERYKMNPHQNFRYLVMNTLFN